jgi:proteasome assembly chaperone (PAC2) family protein
MANALDLWEKPQAEEIFLLAGWRQWADAGSVSSGLPAYLIQQTDARQIGTIRPDGFYLFQVPGTHDLVRPVVKFDEGYPEWLQAQENDLFYHGDDRRGVAFFVGDEPHLDVERYVAAFLQIAQELKVKRIIGFGGVYGELPFNKERMVSCSYSMQRLKDEVSHYSVNLSDYHGGASIGSYLCRRAGEQGIEYVGMYAFVPNYNLAGLGQAGNAIRIETDFMAWLGVMRRVNHMLKLDIPLADLEEKSRKLVELMDSKVDEIDRLAPQLGIRQYLKRVEEEFTETPFDPLDDVWEQELRRLLDKFDEEDER